MFKINTTYVTSYGLARCMKVSGTGFAYFAIIRPSEEATRGGYAVLDRFVAHPDDNTDPSPRTWTEWTGE